MKTLLSVLTAASLVLNLALIALLFAGRASGDAPAPKTATTTAVAAPTMAPAPDAETWSTLRTDDLPAMVQRLRNEGFPPEMVRAIMATQLREMYAARIRALDPQADSRPFWKNAVVDPRIQQAQSKLYREQSRALRELLGPDGDPNEQVNALFQGRRLDSVPSEKLDEVQRMLRDSEDARQDVYSSFSGGAFTPDMQRKLDAVTKNLQESLAQVLTPAELEAYNLRNSDTARQLRGNLSAFNPSEEEFRAIYKLQAEFDERFGRNFGLMSPEESRRRGEAQTTLNEQIKAQLGPVRGAEYERASDFSYRQTSQLVARLELPPETTAKIWDVKQDAERRAAAVRSDSALTPDERTKRLAALAQESTERLTPLLGARGIEPFKQYGGFWLRNLNPPPRPPADPAAPARGP